MSDLNTLFPLTTQAKSHTYHETAKPHTLMCGCSVYTYIVLSLYLKYTPLLYFPNIMSLFLLLFRIWLGRLEMWGVFRGVKSFRWEINLFFSKRIKNLFIILACPFYENIFPVLVSLCKNQEKQFTEWCFLLCVTRGGKPRNREFRRI